MGYFDDIIKETQNRRAQDKQRFEDADGDLCQMCHAYGSDKRSLFIDCGYAVHEGVPEAMDIQGLELERHKGGYYLRICKNCRGQLLGKLVEWRTEAIARRNIPKDHDGNPEESDGDQSSLIPVRINGTTVMMTPDAYAEYKCKPTAAEGE